MAIAGRESTALVISGSPASEQLTADAQRTKDDTLFTTQTPQLVHKSSRSQSVITWTTGEAVECDGGLRFLDLGYAMLLDISRRTLQRALRHD